MSPIYGWVIIILTAIVVVYLTIAAKPPNTKDDSLSAPERAVVSREEQIFEYKVLSDVLKRTVDAVRFIDTLLGLLLTVDMALYAIMLATAELRKAGVAHEFEIAMAIALLDILLTLFCIREAPKAAVFRQSFDLDPDETRATLILQFESIAVWNERWRLVKEMLFFLALTATVVATLAASRAVGV